MGSAEQTFDAVALYATGEGSAPALDGLTEDGAEFWSTDHGRAEAVRLVAKRTPLRSIDDIFAGKDIAGKFAIGLLDRPLKLFIDRLRSWTGPVTVSADTPLSKRA